MTSFYGGGAPSASGGGSTPTKGALIFKGTLGISDDGATVLALPDTHEEGWTYLVVTAGTYAGQLCEKGDFIICVSSGESASDLDWTVVQGNTFSTLPTPTALDEGKIISVGADGNYILADNPAKDKLDKNNGTATGTTTFDKAQANSLELLVDGESIGGFRSIDSTPAVTDKGGEFVPLSIGEPTKDSHAATKKYVDDKAGNYLPLAGGTMTGSINAGENTVTNLKEPKEGTDATTKNYVDGEVAKAAPVSIMPIPEVSGENLIQIKDSVEWPLQGLKVYGKSTQVTTTGASLANPADFSTDDKFIYLFQQNPFEIKPGESYSFTFYNDDTVELDVQVELRENGSNNLIDVAYTNTLSYTNHDETHHFVYFRIYLNESAVPASYRIMLNAGPTALPWEPYTGGKPSPSPEYPQPIVSAGEGGSIALTVSDGAEQSQSLILSTPAGLPGIPVDSGGNYTDASGQQWLANYRDWGRGVDVQMCCNVVLDGTTGGGFDNNGVWHMSPSDQKNLFGGVLIFDHSSQEAFSDRFEVQSSAYDTAKNQTFYVSSDGGSCSMSSSLFETPSIDGFKAYFKANPTRFVVPYAEPIETPIPPDELTAYRALHTYDGTTIISTDEDISGLKVKYVAKAIDYQQSINAAIQETNDKIDAVYNSLVKKAESVDEVNQLFKDWWNANWEEGSSTYNDMLERWFGKVLDDDKVYGVKLPLFETSTSPQGEYIEDSVGATVSLSSDDDSGQNDFAKTPQFWCVEVAAEKNADGGHTIYACEFIDDINVVRNGGPDNGKHLVWVLQKNTYVHEYEDSGYSYIKIQCHPADDFVQWPQGTDRTGHTYSYIANPKYAAGIDDEGNIGCRTGLKPTCYMSMNQTIQAWRTRGPQYSGSSACFYKWAYIMFALLTVKKGEDIGCNNYNYQYAAAVSESGVSRIILTADQANNLYVDSNVIIGNTEGDNDRNQAAMYSLVKLRKISSIEEVNIEEDASSYKAVYIDVPDGTTFDTTAGTTYISTMPYYSGWTDSVKGTIGTKYGINLNKQPCLLQKVELMNGAYNYASDELDQWSQQDDTHYLYDFYLCEDQTKVSTNGTITGDYIKKENATLTIDTAVYTTNNSWYYIEDNLTDNNFKMLSPKKLSTQAGSGTGTRDAFYLSYAASEVRMPNAWAYLQLSGDAGLSCRGSNYSPSWTNWGCAGGSPGLSG